MRKSSNEVSGSKDVSGVRLVGFMLFAKNLTEEITIVTESANQAEQLAALQRRLERIEDHHAIERLQNQYGFYLDNRMWLEVSELFCDENSSLEIGQRGSYIGKARIYRFLSEVLGQGRWGLLKDEIINHIQLQMVITLAPDGQSAEMRSRALVQGNSPPGSGKMLMAEGVYENQYIKIDGVWKIKRVWWVPTFYFEVAGFDGAVFDSGPESASFPPDIPAPPRDGALGRRFLPFHYLHPFTGAEVASPSGAPNPKRKI